MGESKPATLRRELHITYSIWFKGKTGLFARLLFWMESTAVIVFLGWFDRAGSVGLFSAAGGDRALQECNPSTHAVRGLRMHPLPASASSGAGRFAFGNASQPRPKAKNSSSFSLDEVAVNSPALPSGSVMCGFVLGGGNDLGSHWRRGCRLGLCPPALIRGQVIPPDGIQLLFPPKLWLTRL